MASEVKIHLSTYLNDAGIKATDAQVRSLSKRIENYNRDAAAKSAFAWTELVSKFHVIASVAKTAFGIVKTAVKSAFDFETQTARFKTLLGSVEEARRHMQDMKELGDTPPFGMDEFASASRQMLVMSDGALGFKKMMEMVGDAAAATGVSLDTMGHAVGRLYAFIRDGQPLSRAVMELRNMGVITPLVAQELQDMQTAGAGIDEIWAKVTASLSRYAGAMKETEATGNGLVGAIESRWANVYRQLGEAAADAAKGGMTELLDKLVELENSGAVENFSYRTVSFLKDVVDSAVPLLSFFGEYVSGTIGKIQALPRSLIEGVASFWTNISAGNGLAESVRQMGQGVVHGFTEAAYGEDRAAEAANYQEYKRALKEKEAADKKAREEARAKEEQDKIDAALKLAQQRADEARAVEEQKKFDEAQKKFDEECEKELAAWEKEQARIASAEKAAREKREEEERQSAERIMQARISELQDYLSEAERAESAAQARASSAEGSLSTAWGWYRDKASMQRVIDDKLAQAAAEKQWEKDFARLKSFKRDWRTADVGKLSAADEAVRQVAFAKEEKAAADRAVIETAENTRELADKLDELLQSK